MNNYQRLYEKTVEDAKLKDEIAYAKERFTPKPFVSEYYKLKRIASYFHPILSLFSVVTGFAFLFYNFTSTLHVIVATCLAILLLVVIEYAKAETTTLSIRKILMTGRVGNFVLLLFAFAFFGLSIFFSVNGAKELYMQMDTQMELYHTDTEAQKENIKAEYQHKIRTEKNALEEFKESVSWLGKINLQNKTIAQTLASHTARIDSLEAQQARQLQAINTQSQQDIRELEDTTGFNITFWIGLSIGNELLLLVCLVFPVYYQFKTASESEIFTQLTPSLNVNSHDLKRFISNFILNNPENWNTPLSENLPDTKHQSTSYEASNTPPPHIAKAPSNNKEMPKDNNVDIEIENREETPQNKRKPRSNSYDYERIRELKNKGLKVKEIASLLNCSETTIRRARMAK